MRGPIAAFVESLRVEQADFDRVLATVLFMDIVDSTVQAATLGDAGWHDMRARHDQIVRSQIARYRGREIKTMGPSRPSPVPRKCSFPRR